MSVSVPCLHSGLFCTKHSTQGELLLFPVQWLPVTQLLSQRVKSLSKNLFNILLKLKSCQEWTWTPCRKRQAWECSHWLDLLFSVHISSHDLLECFCFKATDIEPSGPVYNNLATALSIVWSLLQLVFELIIVHNGIPLCETSNLSWKLVKLMFTQTNEKTCCFLSSSLYMPDW